jgi:hypothetical protein
MDTTDKVIGGIIALAVVVHTIGNAIPSTQFLFCIAGLATSVMILMVSVKRMFA